MKKHLIAFVLALVVGALYVAPYVYHAYTEGYQGIFMADSGDADFYLTVINKSYQSTGLVGDPFLYEYQETRNPFQYFLIEFALGKIGNTFHLPIDVLATGMEFVFPALLTLLLYAFAYRISGSRLAASFVAIAMLLGTELVHPDGIGNLFDTFLFRGGYREFLMYSRPVNPQISGIFFFAVLFGFSRLFASPHSKKAIALSGIGFGLLAYIYPYFWLFACVTLCLIFVYALVTRQWVLVRSACFTGCTALIVMLPFLFANLSIALGGGASALTKTIPTHRFIVEKVLFLPLILYILIAVVGWKTKTESRLSRWMRFFSEKYPFILILLTAGLVVMNQQVVTGRLMFPQHFHFFTNIPIVVFSLAFLVMELLHLLSTRRRLVVTICVMFIIAWYATGVQISSLKAHRTDSTRYQALAPIFQYLNQESKQFVVFTNAYLATRLTMYTKDFVYGGGYDATFAVPKERLVHSYLVTLSLRGVTTDEIRSYVYERSHREEIGGLLFIGTYWRDSCGSYGCFPDTVLEDIIPKYKDFLSLPLAQTIRKYKIDYLLWDTESEPSWHIEKLVNGPPVKESGDFKLYTVE